MCYDVTCCYCWLELSYNIQPSYGNVWSEPFFIFHSVTHYPLYGCENPDCLAQLRHQIHTQSAALYEIIQKVKLVEFLLLYDVFNTL